MKLYPVAICVIAFLQTTVVQARPISYPGGYTLMLENDAAKNALHLHYTPSINYSLGYRAEYQRDEEFQLHGLQFNYLIKRWNNPASQANFYLKNNFGFAYSDADEFNNKFEPAIVTGIALDWEDRSYYISYENKALWADTINQNFEQKARLGFAPYVAEYGALHTWIMFQVNHHPEAKDTWNFTPLLRLFKADYMFEIGVDFNGKGLFNFIYNY